MVTDRTSQTITLTDGRKLGYAEWGDLSGLPVFTFTGANGRFVRLPDSVTQAQAIRMITVERPGFGLSTMQPNRRLLDWPDDIIQLAESLRIQKFAVMGVSQGGPYAIACACKIPERLTTVTLVSSVAPLQAPGVMESQGGLIKLMLVLSYRMPFLLRGLYGILGGMARRNPQGFMKRTLSNLPLTDQAILSRPDVMSVFVQDLPAAYSQGTEPGVVDFMLVSNPWGFDLKDVRARNVFIWQGETDPNVTPAMARTLAENIPNAEITWVPNAGHFMAYGHADLILKQIRENQ